MNIENNIIKQYLKNCMFIAGTAYAGKSTMCKLLAEKHNLYLCGENYKYNDFRAAARPELQPHMCYQWKDWQEFINRSPEVYEAWIYGIGREVASFEIAELIRVSGNQRVIVDTNIPMDILREITDYNQVAIMLSPQAMSVERFFERDDPEKIFLMEQIKEAKDPQKTLENFKACIARINSKEHYDEYADSGFFTLVREDIEKDTRSEMLYALEKHFGLA